MALGSLGAASFAALIATLFVAPAARADWQRAKVDRLQALSGRAYPAHLEDAKALHRELLQRGHSVRQVYGRAHSPTTHAGSHAGFNMALAAAPAAPPIITPAMFGADPTGRVDSTSAMQLAVEAVLNCSTTRANQSMAIPVADLGGATLDLQGGTYLVSQPLHFPSGTGNFQIVSGTLRVTKAFPAARFVIEIGTANQHNFRNGTDFCYPGEHQGICNQHVNIAEVFVDAGHVARGGISVSNTMGCTIGPATFVYGFVDTGIRVDGGHEIMILEAWVAEYYWWVPIEVVVRPSSHPGRARGCRCDRQAEWQQRHLCKGAKRLQGH